MKDKVIGFVSHFPHVCMEQTGHSEYWVFSNWAPLSFVMDGKKYMSTEQRMMEQKAILFKDDEMANAIMTLSYDFPSVYKMKADDEATWRSKMRKVKGFGRKVHNYSEEKWNEVCKEVVYEAVLAKFSQNEDAAKTLLDTGDCLIAEAAHYDKKWGIGLRPNDPHVNIPGKWKGTNWLGECLMRARETLRKTSKSSS